MSKDLVSQLDVLWGRASSYLGMGGGGCFILDKTDRVGEDLIEGLDLIEASSNTH